MKQFYLLLTGILLLALLAGCSSEDDGSMSADRIAVDFGTGSIARTKTVSAGNGWEQGDKIGIFMITRDAAVISGNVKENADNVQYKANTGNNATSGFTPANTNQTIYYPQNGDMVDFIAYYPYKSPLTNYTYPVDVSTQTTPADRDVLYSNNAKGYDKNSGTVALQFSHALSKLTFNLTSGTGSPSLTNATVTISGIATEGTMDLNDGAVTAINSGQIITANTAADGLSSSAIVLPRSATFAAEKLIVTLTNGDTFDWKFSEGNGQISEWQAGKNHTYNITVDRTGITVTTGNITDWTGTSTQPTEGGAGYKVGAYYPDPTATSPDGGTTWKGTKPIGIVFWVDPADSRHGKVMSLDESSGKWDDGYYLTEANDMSNGRNNMKTIATYISNNNKAWSNFPAFAWVHAKNAALEDYSDANATGVWYLPAKEELSSLYSVYDTYGKSDFNTKLQNAGGTALSNSWYWSSSEGGRYYAWFVGFGYDSTSTYNKSINDRVRAVLAF